MAINSSQGVARSVLIVGGGAAGWLTAAYLANTLGTEESGGPRITVLESPDIATVGVGEGTFPTIRNILRNLGIEEAQFMRECQATFKQGIRFEDWETAPQGDVHSHYLHPFESPYWGKEELNLVPYWLIQDPKTRLPFASAVTFQAQVADAQLGPKRLHQGNFAGPLNYAYHFDAAKFARVVARQARTLGVHHLSGTVMDVALDATGAIDHIVSDQHGVLSASLYIDCTGFRSELIGKAMQVPFRSIHDVLFTDRALTCQVPYPDPATPLASYTISTAHEAGWTWDIALPTRRGVGYVYSSKYSSDERAEEVLRAYVKRGPWSGTEISTRLIAFETGYRTAQWVKNCVAVGLSAGFLEPLESTGMVLIESAISKIAEFFPHQGPVDASASIFNDLMVKRFETIINFIKLHYCLSRREAPFWRDNTAESSIPPRLQELLALWRYRPPSRYDFVLDHESFAYFSYQYILYGMNFVTEFEAARGALPMKDKAEQIMARVQMFGEQAVKDLIPHRTLIDAVYSGGFTDRPQMAAAR